MDCFFFERSNWTRSFFQVNNDRSRKNFEGVENRNIKFIEKVHYFSILPVLTYLYSSRDKRRSRRKILTINEKCSKKTATFYWQTRRHKHGERTVMSRFKLSLCTSDIIVAVSSRTHHLSLAWNYRIISTPSRLIFGLSIFPPPNLHASAS